MYCTLVLDVKQGRRILSSRGETQPVADHNSTPTNPGREIERLLAERGWTHDDLAAVLGKQRPHVTSLVSGKRSITPDWAVLLAAALGTTAEYWLRLEGERQLSLIPLDDVEDVSRRSRAVNMAPIKEMERRGWIAPATTGEGLERELKKFFGVDSLECDPPVVAAARKSNPDSPLDRQQRAWVARARQLAASHPAHRFDRDRIPELVSKLRKLAAYPKESADACEVLRQFGIRFVVVEPLEKCRIDGAAFWVGESPAIAMSLRHGRIDAFWFTLMHELAHIIHNDVASVDLDLSGKSQLPSRLKPDVERRADETAADLLIPASEMNSFINLYSPLYSKARIIQFAHRVKIHPGIIVGQLQHRAELGWDAARSMLTDVREYVINSALTDGWGKSISPGTLD